MAIDRAEVRRIAELAQLELDDATVDSLTRDLESILNHVALLDTLDVSQVDPAVGALEHPPAPRADRVRPSLTNDEALANAPAAADGHFRVPRVLSE